MWNQNPSRGPMLAPLGEYIRQRGDINVTTLQLVMFYATGQSIITSLCGTIVLILSYQVSLYGSYSGGVLLQVSVFGD